MFICFQNILQRQNILLSNIQCRITMCMQHKHIKIITFMADSTSGAARNTIIRPKNCVCTTGQASFVLLRSQNSQVITVFLLFIQLNCLIKINCNILHKEISTLGIIYKLKFFGQNLRCDSDKYFIFFLYSWVSKSVEQSLVSMSGNI